MQLSGAAGGDHHVSLSTWVVELSKHVTEALLHCGEATWQTAIGWFVVFFGLGNYYLSWFFFF